MKKHFAKQIFAAALAISFVCGLSACREREREREEEQLALKPVIYLYPEEETDVSVTLAYDGALTAPTRITKPAGMFRRNLTVL